MLCIASPRAGVGDRAQGEDALLWTRVGSGHDLRPSAAGAAAGRGGLGPQRGREDELEEQDQPPLPQKTTTEGGRSVLLEDISSATTRYQNLAVV